MKVDVKFFCVCGRDVTHFFIVNLFNFHQLLCSEDQSRKSMKEIGRNIAFFFLLCLSVLTSVCLFVSCSLSS